MSLRDGENQDLVGVFVDGSQEVQGQHKEVSALLPQKSTTVDNPAWASGPSEIIRYFTCSGSPVQDRGFESLRNFWKGRFKCLSSRAVANSHAA